MPELTFIQKQNWRFVYSGQNGPYFNMAVDEALLCSVRNGSMPVLRLYGWNPAAISIGYFQAVKNTVDLDKCIKAGVKIVRRITGGRAVLHDEELTYSFSGSSKIFPELGNNISETYRRISKALLSSLSILGVEAQWIRSSGGEKGIGSSSHEKENRFYSKTIFSQPCFSSFSRYEISHQGRKLIGSAQRRFGDVFLQHGSILLKKGELKLVDFLPANSLVEKTVTQENSTDLEEIKGEKIEHLEMVQALKHGFSRFFQKDFAEGFLTPEERNVTERLMAEKYSQDSWNFKF